MVNINFGATEKVRISVACEPCGKSYEISTQMPANLTLNTGAINFKNACPACKGDLSAPSGTYTTVDGVMTRVGDQTE